MPPAGRGRGRVRPQGGQGGAPAPILPFLFSPAGRTVPVVLYVGRGGPQGPADNASAVGIPSSCGLVLRMSFVPWVKLPLGPDGIERVALSHFQFFRLFGWRCSVGPSAADKAAAGRVHMFNCRLSADAWSRILSAAVEAGLLERPCHSMKAWEASLSALVLPPEALQLRATDWVLADSLVIPQAGGDADLIARMSYLRFLSLATLALMEDAQDRQRPLRDFAYLVGAFGPCLSQLARENEVAPLHLTCQQLRDHLCARSIPDGQATAALKRALPEMRLPPMLQALSVSAEELASELMDALQYTTATQRVAVEQRRIQLMGERCKPLCLTYLCTQQFAPLVSGSLCLGQRPDCRQRLVTQEG